MTGLQPLLHEARLRWWRWALAHLSTHQPLHPDLPMVLRRVSELESAR